MTTIGADQQLATVAGIYEAFGRGDIPAILECLAPDVAWDRFDPPTTAQETGVEYLRARTGPAEVGDFFAALAGLEFHTFDVTSLTGGGGRVVAEIRIEITVKATGKTIRDTELHVWDFDDAGRVREFRHFVDTARHTQASQQS